MRDYLRSWKITTRTRRKIWPSKAIRANTKNAERITGGFKINSIRLEQMDGSNRLYQGTCSGVCRTVPGGQPSWRCSNLPELDAALPAICSEGAGTENSGIRIRFAGRVVPVRKRNPVLFWRQPGGHSDHRRVAPGVGWLESAQPAGRRVLGRGNFGYPRRCPAACLLALDPSDYRRAGLHLHSDHTGRASETPGRCGLRTWLSSPFRGGIAGNVSALSSSMGVLHQCKPISEGAGEVRHHHCHATLGAYSYGDRRANPLQWHECRGSRVSRPKSRPSQSFKLRESVLQPSSRAPGPCRCQPKRFATARSVGSE